MPAKIAKKRAKPAAKKATKKVAAKKATAKKTAAKKAAKHDAAVTPRAKPKFRQVRKDAAIATIIRRIQKTFKLPDGSVKLVLPSGQKAHADGRIKNLLAKWDAA